MTGKCVEPDRERTSNGTYNVCEIHSWCPVEYDHLPMPGGNFSHPHLFKYVPECTNPFICVLSNSYFVVVKQKCGCN